MSENDKNKNTDIAAEESVDDILAGILNPDGTFNDEFNGLFAKYVGGGQTAPAVPDVDLSDRTDEDIPKERVEYDSGEFNYPKEKTADERIAEKMPQHVRDIYEDASTDAQRPEFTAAGDVRYPTMGVGEAEERVVFDADWEEKAKKEAARRERVRQDRMLRGDSTYARTFVAGGMYMPQRNPYVDAPGANPLYIDPLSGDEDFEAADETSAYYNSNKKPFFPEGFSAAQKSSSAAGGKTTHQKSGRVISSDRGSRMSDGASADWLRVEDKNDKKKKKKRGLNARKKGSLRETEKRESEPSDIDILAAQITEKTAEVSRPRVSPFAGEDISAVEDETRGLRSTVAEIVDKYNKRSEEEARRKLEEETRREELRREEELRERRRQEEIRLMKQDMSPELCDAIDSEEEAPSFDEYDDFSTVPAEKKEETPAKVFGVVFDPSVFDGDEYVEKLDGDEYVEKLDGDAVTEEKSDDGKNTETVSSSGKKKKRKK